MDTLIKHEPWGWIKAWHSFSNRGGKDMLFWQKTIIDWEKLKQLRQQQAEHNNSCKNKKRTKHYTFHVGDKMLLVTPVNNCRTYCKLSSPTEAPYVITKVYQNGMIKILHNNFEGLHQMCPPILSLNTTQQRASNQKIFLHKIMGEYIIGIPLV